MSQYKVPQKIDLQDKIVGPLTLFQFVYLLVGGMTAFGIYKLGSIFLTVGLALPIALLAIAFAFVKIQDQPFGKFLFNFLLFVFSPKARVWHHGKSSAPLVVKSSVGANEQKPQTVAPKPLDRRRLAAVSSEMDK